MAARLCHGHLAGTLTRRYHGLLIAAVDPPSSGGPVVAASNSTSPTTARRTGCRRTAGTPAHRARGYLDLEAFELNDGLPTWTYACETPCSSVTFAMPLGADATAGRIAPFVRARGSSRGLGPPRRWPDRDITARTAPLAGSR